MLVVTVWEDADGPRRTISATDPEPRPGDTPLALRRSTVASDQAALSLVRTWLAAVGRGRRRADTGEPDQQDRGDPAAR